MIKRAFDIFLSAISMIFLAPLLLVIAAVIKIDSKGPVFYMHERVGKDFKIFRLIKFRTMKVNADKEGPGLTLQDDPRVTRAGRMLRKYKLDELPQLLNVLKGEMSFVGPRPEIPEAVERYKAEYGRLLTARPGITSPASIKNIDEEKDMPRDEKALKEHYLSRILPEKIRADLAYSEKNGMLSDIMIICKTFGALAFGKKRDEKSHKI